MHRKAGFALAFAVALFTAGVAVADASTINFDTVMHRVWTGNKVMWNVIKMYEVLPADFSLEPDVCDINGGFDISVTPIILFENEILDSDEYALVAAILADPEFDCTATAGTSHQQVHDAWLHNYEQTWHDLGGGVGGNEIFLPPGELFPELQWLFNVMMTIGDSDTMAFPLLIMDMCVNNDTVRYYINDSNLHVPDPTNYIRLYPYLGWCGDADGDGCSNLTEYQYYYPTGGRSAYLAAAMDPNTAPPGHGGDRMCDGTGGLLGEYFSTRFLTHLTATRLDNMISFDWGRGIPHPAIAENNFSVCWSGYVIPRFSEIYTFSVRTDDGVRLWVNDELLVDQWTDHGSTTYSGTTSTTLAAGQKYSIRMEFYENGGDAVAWLGWESASQPRKAIYEMYLEPATEGYGERGADWFRNPANGHYYRFTEPLPWLQGRNVATSWGGYLATINDAAEDLWIRTTLGVICDSYYVGGNDRDVEGAWAWEDGSVFWNGKWDGALVAPWYANWSNNEPNDAGGNEDCCQIYSGSGKWNDLSGTSALRCLVESETPKLNYTNPFPGFARLIENFPAKFTVTVRRPFGEVSYQWKKNGVDIPGATEATLSMKAKPDKEGQYSCVIADESGATVETNYATLYVIPISSLPAAGSAALALLAALLAAIAVKRRVAA